MIRAILTAAFAVLALPAAAQVDIQEVTSPGGIDAWLVEDHSIPFVALDIRFQGGTSLDLPGKRGATYLMTGLLEEGAGGMTDQEFAAAEESLAARFSWNAYGDSVVISAEMLTETREASADLLRAAIMEPAFDETAFERVRGQVLSIIAGNQNDPDDIAPDTFAALAYGDHPYASQQEGTPESLAGLTPDDLHEAHRRLFTRDRLYVGAAGDITPEELGALLDHLFGDLPETGAEDVGEAPWNLTGGVTVVEFPTPQSVAFFGHPGIARDDPDFFPAFVLNQILGGGNFRSRLQDQVRVQRGLTYGIGTYLALSDHRPMLLGQFSSSNNLVAQAIEVVQAEWADIAENGVTETELEAAKLYLTGAYPLRFDGNANIAGILAGMQQDHMPVDYINTRNANVEAVTLEDVRRVAARLLQPDELHFVVVGRPEGLESSD
ncbi:insulinase family protein [Rhodobacterales bacterium HKCCE2091]|nr:insulinase family protein [Rhodobacterales bacterium HKCCE2091]